MPNQKENLECVGSLVVNSSDVRELTHSENLECVGSLVVPSSDLKELQTRATKALKDELKKDECIGTLLVHKSDLQELSDGQESPSLRRRITDHMNNIPEPTPEELETIMGDV
uniref:Uncharacterized protein n=1 Tax=Pseudictyota dubia TaxID=2749911 RepID=A0A7R9W6Y9_9STRA|mmetsp:Transcript_37012/g.68557  ORF Transcript_37012/g.68557 Transcript_37012/m.68557 type:complete len:113 (+) Transcript_37012:122-460(+)